MRIFAYPHRLHSVESVDDGQPVESQISILQKKRETLTERICAISETRISKLRTLTLLSNSILNASGPRCDILSKFSQMQVRGCVSSPNNAQIPHILPASERTALPLMPRARDQTAAGHERFNATLRGVYVLVKGRENENVMSITPVTFDDSKVKFYK